MLQHSFVMTATIQNHFPSAAASWLVSERFVFRGGHPFVSEMAKSVVAPRRRFRCKMQADLAPRSLPPREPEEPEIADDDDVKNCDSCEQTVECYEKDKLPEVKELLKWLKFNISRQTRRKKATGSECYHCIKLRLKMMVGDPQMDQRYVVAKRKSDPVFKEHWDTQRRLRGKGELNLWVT